MEDALKLYKRCSQCNEKKQLAYFYIDKTHRDGYRTECKLCKSAKSKAYFSTSIGKGKRKQRDRSSTQRYNQLRSKAKRSGRELAITQDQFIDIVKNTCIYCKRDMKNTTGHCLDRKDTSLGYTMENAVPCCGLCNQVKMGFFTFDEMMRVIAPAVRQVLDERGVVLAVNGRPDGCYTK